MILKKLPMILKKLLIILKQLPMILIQQQINPLVKKKTRPLIFIRFLKLQLKVFK